MKSTHVPLLSLLPSGWAADEALDLFHSPQMLELFRCARRDFDYVLIDSPPVLQIPDARVLARFADSVILLIRAGHTPRDVAFTALNRFAEDHTPVLGTILNQWDPRRGGNSEYYRNYIDLYRENNPR